MIEIKDKDGLKGKAYVVGSGESSPWWAGTISQESYSNWYVRKFNSTAKTGDAIVYFQNENESTFITKLVSKKSFKENYEVIG